MTNDPVFHALLGAETTTQDIKGKKCDLMEVVACCDINLGFFMTAEQARLLSAALIEAANHADEKKDLAS